MVIQGTAKYEGPVAGWHLIGLAREVQKEPELVFSVLQGSKEYFATLTYTPTFPIIYEFRKNLEQSYILILQSFKTDGKKESSNRF